MQQQTSNIWLFQARPDIYDLTRMVQAGQTDQWYVRQYTNEITSGDIVYFYQSGERAGVYGWGRTVSTPFEVSIKQSSANQLDELMVEVVYEVRFPEPILRQQFQNTPEWERHQLFTAHVGTNFKVSPAQAEVLNKVIQESGFLAPKIGITPTAQLEQLASISVNDLIANLSSETEVSIAQIVNHLLETHPDYAGGLAKELRVSELGEAIRRPMIEWLTEVLGHYNLNDTESFRGRMVILGLSRLDGDLADQLGSTFIETSKSELSSDFDALLSPIGKELWGVTDRAYLHLDNPALEDRLGRVSYAKTLAKYLRFLRNQRAQTNKTDHKTSDNFFLDQSFILHLYGPWGSGKSTLLRFLGDALMQEVSQENNLDFETRPWIVINFNAWQHQRIDPPWWALMNSVFQQARQQLWRKRKFRAASFWLREQGWRILTVSLPRLLAVIVIALIVYLGVFFLRSQTKTPPEPIDLVAQAKTIDVLLGVAALIAGSAYTFSRSLLPGTAQAAQYFSEMSQNPTDRIKKHFAQMIKWIDSPVAIFIDDLDRCEATYVVKLLEGIQTLFRSAPVTYVVAADAEWLRASYSDVYKVFKDKVGESGLPLDHLFMEKIFQLSAPIPGILSSYKESYWNDLLRLPGGFPISDGDYEKLEAEAEQELRGKVSANEIIETIQAQPANGLREMAYRSAAAKRLIDPDVRTATEHRLAKFRHLTGPNPRTMKRLVNTYVIYQGLVTLTGVEIDADRLPLWAILTMRWPSLAEYLSEHPDHIQHMGVALVDPHPIAANFRSLFLDQEVIDLVQGKDIYPPIELDETTIRSCTQLIT